MNRRARLISMLLVLCVPACGGEAENVPGPQPPPPATGAPTAEKDAQLTATAAATTPPPTPKRPLADLQREALKNLVAAFNAHDAKKVAALYTADVLSGAPGPAGWMEDKSSTAIEESHTRLFGAFPDMKWASAAVYVKGDVVIQEWVSNATHKGDLGEMKASGKPTGIHGASVYWFNEDGQIKKDNTYFDSATIAIQTGSMPGKPRAIPQIPASEPQWATSSGAPEEGKRVEAAKAMYAAFSGADEKAFLATMSSDVERVAFNQAETRKGHKDAAEGYKSMHKAFPDLKVAVGNAWGFGDKVVTEVTMTGTHQGDIGPIKATKKAVTLHMLDVLTFGKDEKITAIASYASNVELLGQLDALGPKKGATPATPAKSAIPPKK